jgi:eukaryotic-like serine/threonine-protein kinase
MTLPTGTRLGSYEVLALLGQGGMGEVYRAWDARLKRDVAIKILPPALAADPDRIVRFEREARSVAQLSHPNVVAIFDVGQERPAPEGPAIAYAVMELVEGETLRARLARGRPGTRRTIEIGVQIAEGLAAAHDKGIVHRDLKPENVVLTPGDRVKILDFGLARVRWPAGLDETATQAVTAEGTVLGTVGYMAPEQVRAQPVDERADIFACGAVLYELLAGRPPFGGESAADTLSAILHHDPPAIDVPGDDVPSALDLIVRRCLEKQPARRFQSAHDLAFALETLAGRGSGATAARASAPAAARRLPAAVPWIVAALAVLGGALSWAAARGAPAADLWHVFTPITDMAGVETMPALTPDGTLVAYATRAAGTWDIYAQHVSGSTPIPLATDPAREEAGPAFSPDGRSLAYHDARGTGAIFVATAAGAAPRRLTDFGFHPAWSPDSRQIAFSSRAVGSPYMRVGESALWIVDAAGGTPRRVEGTGDAALPAWSPSGAHLAYSSIAAGQRDISMIAAEGGTPVAVTRDTAVDWSPTWSPDGRFIYFASDRGGSMNLWRIAVDEASGVPQGRAEPVTTGVQAAADQPAFSADGARLVFRSSVHAANPTAVPFDPVTLRAGTPVILSNSNTIRLPTDVSRDGRFVAYSNLGEPQEDLFVSGADGSGFRRLTPGGGLVRGPVWAADGQSLFFHGTRDGAPKIWTVGLDGGGLREAFAVPGASLCCPLVSPDGARLVVSAMPGSPGPHLVRLAPDGTAADAELLAGLPDGMAFLAAAWSPDGARLAGQLVNATGTELGLAVYDLAARRIERRFDARAVILRWLPDSRRLLYLTESAEAFRVLDVDTGQTTDVGAELPLPGGLMFALSPDGRTIYYGGTRHEADIWMVERLPPAPR